MVDPDHPAQAFSPGSVTPATKDSDVAAGYGRSTNQVSFEHSPDNLAWKVAHGVTTRSAKISHGLTASLGQANLQDLGTVEPPARQCLFMVVNCLKNPLVHALDLRVSKCFALSLCVNMCANKHIRSSRKRLACSPYDCSS